mmetsp:Transcript_14358/g.60497  ORF Transcript_14358/g.60497 Transcript_14358/m.60497 type:complete len:317 (+) Transcript_14358:811-1761(+)
MTTRRRRWRRSPAQSSAPASAGGSRRSGAASTGRAPRRVSRWTRTWRRPKESRPKPGTSRPSRSPGDRGRASPAATKCTLASLSLSRLRRFSSISTTLSKNPRVAEPPRRAYMEQSTSRTSHRVAYHHQKKDVVRPHTVIHKTNLPTRHTRYFQTRSLFRSLHLAVVGADGFAHGREAVFVEALEQLFFHLRQHARPLVRERRVQLHEGRARSDLAVRVLPVAHPPAPHQRNRAPRRGVHQTQHLRGRIHERRARKPAGFAAVRMRAHAIRPRDGGVADDDPVHLRFSRGARDVAHVALGQVGRDLEQHGRAATVG